MNVYLPKDRITNNHQGYGFVEFRTEEDADYVRAADTRHSGRSAPDCADLAAWLPAAA